MSGSSRAIDLDVLYISVGQLEVDAVVGSGIGIFACRYRMLCTGAKIGTHFFTVLRAGAIFSNGSKVNIDGKTSFVNNSATSDVQANTGGGQILNCLNT